MLTKPHRPLPYAMGQRLAVNVRRARISPSLGIVPAAEPLANPRGFALGGNNNVAGFTPTSGIDKFSQAAKTTATISAVLPQARTHGGCGVRGKFNGYILGGSNAAQTPLNEIDRFNLATESLAVLAVTMPAARSDSQVSATSNVATKGYSHGGFDPALGAPTKTTYAFTFMSETAVQLSSLLANDYSHITSVSSKLAGYLAGGNTAGPVLFGAVNTFYKFGFTTEAVALLSAVLEIAKFACGPMNGPLKGYIAGGLSSGGPPNDVATIRAIDFTTETAATTTFSLAAIVQAPWGWSFPDRGYVAGGTENNANARYNTIYETIWSFETSGLISATLPQSRGDCAPIHTPGMP